MRLGVFACALAGCGGSTAAGVHDEQAAPERCDPTGVLRSIEMAPLRAYLGRLGKARLARSGPALDAPGFTADEAVPVLAEDDDRVRVAIRGQGITVLLWVDRADLEPVTLVEHRVSNEPGTEPAGDVGITVFPGHPVVRTDRRGWVRVSGHGLLTFDGWIPDDAGDLWEPATPAPPIPDTLIQAGSSIVDDPDAGKVLAIVDGRAQAHLLESSALGADKIELADGDVRVVGYPTRPPLKRSTSYDFPDDTIGEPTGTPVVEACLRTEPGGPIVGVADGPLVDIRAASTAGWALTPITTPWGDLVLALPAPAWMSDWHTGPRRHNSLENEPAVRR